jgi:hypothetical protein
MMKKLRNHLLYKGFLALPLWGKIAVPVALVLLISFLGSILSKAFYIGIFLVIAYFIFSGILYFTDKKKT